MFHEDSFTSLDLTKFPIYVSISPRPCTWSPGNALLVLNRLPLAPPPKPNSHAHCISTIYNRWNDAEMLVEMVEASKIIGEYLKQDLCLKLNLFKLKLFMFKLFYYKFIY